MLEASFGDEIDISTGKAPGAEETEFRGLHGVSMQPKRMFAYPEDALSVLHFFHSANASYFVHSPTQNYETSHRKLNGCLCRSLPESSVLFAL